ncbi:MAG: hypothetical protein ACFFCQ_05515 [Promethearchaeota archaeon]
MNQENKICIKISKLLERVNEVQQRRKYSSEFKGDVRGIVDTTDKLSFGGE